MVKNKYFRQFYNLLSEVIIERNRENNRGKIKNCLLLLLAGSN